MIETLAFPGERWSLEHNGDHLLDGDGLPVSGLRIDAEFRALHSLLGEVAGSGVELDDERMRYVVVQIGRETWNQLAPFRAKKEALGE